MRLTRLSSPQGQFGELETLTSQFKNYFPRDKFILFGYFIVLILIGSLGYAQDWAWKSTPPPFIDALFTSVSAVCVTGLATVLPADMTLFGQILLMIQIQFGGLGIITVTSMLFLLPRTNFSLSERNLIRDFFVSSVEYKPQKIIARILLFTLGIEAVGFLAVLITTPRSDVTVFSAMFHSVSAFNNAGFSLYPESLLAWKNFPLAIFLLTGLVIVGGLGYVVLQEILEKFAPIRMAKGQRAIMSHSLLVIIMTAILLLLGFLLTAYSDIAFAGRNPANSEVWFNSWIHSVMTRTAGYNYLPTSELSTQSQVLSIPLMLIGAGPGSTAGGVKVTTFALFLVFLFRGHRTNYSKTLGHEEIRFETIQKAVLLFTRFFIVFLLLSTLLVVTERWIHPDRGLLPLLFETASALGTVGLSLDVTPSLSGLGKGIIMLAMFTGRVGLLAFIVWSPKDDIPRAHRPKAEVLLG